MSALTPVLAVSNDVRASAVQFLSQCWVAIRRTEALLLLEECTHVTSHTKNVPSPPSPSEKGLEMAGVVAVDGGAHEAWEGLEEGVALRMTHFSATWDPEPLEVTNPPCPDTSQDLHLALTDIELTVRTGELIVIVGPVGSSKSSLLMAILGELAPLSTGEGRLQREGTYGYCSQEPWIMSTTVKENILFGSPYDEERYLGVLRSCDLLSDLQLLSAGDQTVIGDRGINLSGGQRARVVRPSHHLHEWCEYNSHARWINCSYCILPS